MNRTMVEENGEVKNSSYVKQESSSYGYDPSYLNYSTATLNQPLPGQPPLPPMPPPQGTVPPPPGVYGTVQAQVAPLHAWPHTAAWQWIAPQATAIATQSATTAFQREIPMRNNFSKRERYNNHNRNAIYQRDNFHRKNRRQRYDQSQQAQFDQSAYYGTPLTSTLPLDWQSMQIPMQNQLHMATTVANVRRTDDPAEPDAKEEHVMKKNKQRKPMSQCYPTRPWNREDAERALKIESEYNKTVKAQSLIIKFPDPDLNKDIVREFHSGIKSIHFQSPSGPRYCFIQMDKNVNVDEAINELEKIPFGNGYLKVEKKSLRDEDAPTPEEIDPYTLYIGNLPESVNVNEVKSKFQSAARVDVGYAQKMRNTRYAFIRYNSVDESVEAYKQAHDLMWDTRSIIVRFRRQRGNTCLPGEPKSNPKKKDGVSKTPSATHITQGKDKSNDKSNNGHATSSKDNHVQPNDLESHDTLESQDTLESNSSIGKDVSSITDPNTSVNTEKQNEPSLQNTNVHSTPVDGVIRIQGEIIIQGEQDDMTIITEIKEEPEDYDEMSEMCMGQDDDEEDDDLYSHEVEEDDDEHISEENLRTLKRSMMRRARNVILSEDIPSDSLDKLFSDITHGMAGNVGS